MRAPFRISRAQPATSIIEKGTFAANPEWELNHLFAMVYMDPTQGLSVMANSRG